MIRRVAFQKAILAGALGALAWELAARLLILLGLPLFDIVHTLGTLPVANAPPWLWWPLGMTLHALVGAIWAIFYAYFFWSSFPWRPPLQGLAFSFIPMTLAGLIMVPQLALMHPHPQNLPAPHKTPTAMNTPPTPGSERSEDPDPSLGPFAYRLGFEGPLAIVLGHLLYGLTLGSLYRRPVGHRTGTGREHALHDARPTPPLSPATPPDAIPDNPNLHITDFMFATGIECSAPTIDHGRWRMDQLDMTEHYRYWRTDLQLVHDLGLRYLRYGPPIHWMYQAPARYDWSFMDDVANHMRRLGIVPLIDLVHFGLPHWLANFQNPDLPHYLSEYAAAFAQRYPWIRFYTPVNEMYVTAKLSALDGIWNEQLRSERAFVTAVRNLARSSVLMFQAILRQRPDAIMINSESSEFYQACCPQPDITRIADFENQRRFIAMDLLYAVPVRRDILQYLTDNGLPRDEYDWFMRQRLAHRAILGVDYYEWNEKVINADCHPQTLGELFGWYVITKQYYDRYQRPLMHTETNCQDAQKAPAWIWRQWHNVQMMRRDGIPVVGFTWYSLQDQVDWNIGLTQPLGNVNPVGLFDLNRDPRPVAQAYKHLLHMHRHEKISLASPHRELDQLLTTAP